jgi:hypothetical protein
MNNLFYGFALICALWGVISAIQMAAYLSKRGYKISPLFFKIMVPVYIYHYSRITIKESGKPGAWFYSYIMSMILVLAMVIIGAVLK